MEVLTRFPSSKRQLRSHQHNATPSGRTSDAHSSTHFTQATQSKQKRVAIKNGRFSASTLFRKCSRRPDQAHDFYSGLLLEITYEGDTKMQYSDCFAPFIPPVFHNTPQSGLTVSIIIKPF